MLTCKIETITCYKHTFRFCVKNWNAQLQNPGEVAVFCVQINCCTSYLEQFVKQKKTLYTNVKLQGK